MPRIPSADNIARRTPGGVSNVVRMDTSQVGGGLDDLSAGLGSMAQRDSEFQTSKANLAFLKAKHEIESELKNDPDYKTHENRYNETLSKKLGELSVDISDPRARTEFLNRGQLTTENGRVAVQSHAFNKETEHEISGVDEDAHSAKEMYLGTNDPQSLQLIKESMNARYETAFKQGYITETQMTESKRSWRDDVAVSKLKMLDPEDQLLALKQNFAKDLPIDVRNNLKKLATAEVIKNKAVDMVDGYLEADMDEEEALVKIETIKDKKLRKEVETRWNYDSNRLRIAKAEEQVQLKSQFSYDVSEGDLRVDDIIKNNREEWDAMDDFTQMYYRNLEAKSVEPAKFSDPSFLLNMSKLISNSQWEDAQKYFELGGKKFLSRSDYQDIGLSTHEGLNAEVKDQMNDNQAIDVNLRAGGIFSEDKNLNKATLSKLLFEVKNWRRDFQESGRKPDDKERDEFIRQRMTKVPIDGGWFGADTEKPLFMLDEGEFDLSLEEMADENPEVMEKMNQLESLTARKLTEVEIAQLYSDELKTPGTIDKLINRAKVK